MSNNIACPKNCGFLYSVIFVIISIFGITNSIYGQEKTPTLTKEEAISKMLEGNFGIKLAENNIEIAENNTSLLNAGYLPSLTGNAGASYDNTDNVTDFNGALNQDGDPRPDVEINDAETRRYNASINLDYTLFDGFGRKYNYQVLKEQYNLSKLQARETIENTTIQLLSIYYDVARLTENVSVLQEVMKVSKDRELRASYRFDYGQSSKLELLNAQVDRTTDSINLLNAEQQLQNAKRDLNLVLNSDLENNFVVDTTVVFVNPIEIAQYVEGATGNNVSLLQIEQDIVISDYQIKSAKSLLLPTIGLTGSYGWNRNENPASAFFPGTTNKSNSLALGANLRWNIFDGGRSLTAIKNAKIVYENQELSKQQLELQIHRDIKNAQGNYENALKIFDLQNQNVITSEDNFKRSAERLKLGQITSVEFRQAQINLINAMTTKNAAKYQAKFAEVQLLQLAGQLLNVSY